MLNPQYVAIWLLCVIIGGLAITGIVLWWHRDQDEYPPDRWQRAAGFQPPADVTPLRPPVQDPTAYLGWIEALHMWHARGAEHAPKRSAATPVWSAAPASAERLATLHEAAGDHAAAEALRAWYAAREEAQTQRLLDAGAARWG